MGAVCEFDSWTTGMLNIYLQVEESGMEVLKKEEKILSKEEAAEFYKQHEGSEHFDQLVEFMSRYCKIKSLLWDLAAL